MKPFAAFLLFASATLAMAQADECVQYRAQYNGRTTAWVATPAAACSALNGGYQAGGNATSDVVTNSRPDPANPAVCVLDRTITYEGGTSTSGGGNAPIESQTTPGQCTDLCKAKQGRDTTVNWTFGYSRNAMDRADVRFDLIAPPVMPPADGMMCVDGCTVAATYDPATSVPYRSAAPTDQGLYRYSMDYDAQHMGSACVPSEADKAASPNAPMPTCPGSLGTVNGQPHCAGTAANPVRNDTVTKPPDRHEEGNPRAGEKPASGEGSGSGGAGRTPSQGNGGPGGGPSSAAGNGQGPDGNTDEPGEGKEQQACGAPGQPKCKIDETGTPDGKGDSDKLEKAVKEAGQKTKEGIENASKLKADGWTFSFQLPTGCTNLILAGFQSLAVDVCRWQPLIHDIMSLAWLAATIWACIAMVGATLRGE